MPVPERMSWVKSQRLWRKWYQGKWYTVSPRQLRAYFNDPTIPDDKDGSKIKANLWWDRKEFELQAATCPVPRPISTKEELALAYKCLPREEWEPFLRRLDAAGVAADTINQVHAELIRVHAIEGEAVKPCTKELLAPAAIQHLDGLVALAGGQQPAVPNNSLRSLSEKYLQEQRGRVGVVLTPAKLRLRVLRVGTFLGFAGPNLPADKITEETLVGYYNDCGARVRDETWSRFTATDAFAEARKFIRWLYENRHCERPRNLDSRQFSFRATPKAVDVWTVEEFKWVLGRATERTGFFCLLMANTGTTQADLANLRDHEVDWENGRITRRRTKTAYLASVPTVSYLLWPRTFELLKQYRSGKDRVLLAENGSLLMNSRMNAEGGVTTTRPLTRAFQGFRKRTGFTKSLKLIRKMSASLISQSAEYHDLASLFLGHAPRSMAERHYLQTPQARLDQAVLWLGRQLGQVTPEPAP
jgi:integrase